MPAVTDPSWRPIEALLKLPDTLPVIFHITDNTGALTQVSDLWLKTLGYERDEVLGQRSYDFLAPRSKARALSNLQSFLQKGNFEGVDYEFLTKNGTTISCKLAASTVCAEDGTILGRVAFITLPEADSALLHRLDTKSARLQSCIEGTNAGIWEWNVQTGETLFNDRWAEIVGYSLEELGSVSIQTWLDLAHPDDLKASEQALKDHWEGKTPFYDVKARMRHKDGHWVWVHDRGRVFTWTGEGQPEWMFGTHFGIEDQMRAEMRSERMNKLLERMGEMAGVGGWEVDLLTNEVLWTQETRRIHGVANDYTPNIAEGISFYAPEARTVISEAVDRGMRDGTPWDLELPFIRLNGERIWVRAVGEVEFDDSGTPIRLFGAFQDISERVNNENDLRATRDWMQLATSSGGVGLWSCDAVDGTVHWDDTMAKHFMVPKENRPETVSDWLALVPESAASKIKAQIKQLLSGRGRIDTEIDFSDTKGISHALKLTGELRRDSDGLIDRINGACFDLTPERRLMMELQEQSSKLSVTLSSIGDGVITTDRDCRITWLNDVASRLSGWSLEDAVGKPSDEVFAVFDQTSGQPAINPVEQCLRESQVVALQPNSVLRTKSGHLLPVDDSAAPIIDQEGRSAGAVVVFRDVSEQRALSRDIEYRATHDLLTGLLNRNEFQKRLISRLSNPVQRNSSFLFFLDLDHFKRVNDTYGHDVGDKLLHAVGQLLRDKAGADADIARHGGDEFVLLKTLQNETAASDFAESLCKGIAGLSLAADTGPDSTGVGACAGVVNMGLAPGGSEEQMRYADIAAYTAKRRGQNQVCFWSENDQPMQSAARQISLVEQIERANAEGLWVVHEQRIASVATSDGAVDMRELLIRLPDAEGTLIAPDQFLDAAERYGLMSVIDLWMVRYGIERVTVSGDDTIFTINLSPSSVSSRSFRKDLSAVIEEVPRNLLRRICFEITETSLVQDFDQVSGFLTQLQKLGLSIAIDDFGAGASSFRYFRDLPADYLKIDGSFIRNYTDPVTATSLECFVRMAQVVGLKTIAEHVEDAESMSCMIDMGFDYLQGFAIERPKAVA